MLLCLIEIFSEFQEQTGGNLIFDAAFTTATVADIAAHQGACQESGTDGVIMIRIISFRGTAAMVVITYGSITGGIKIPFLFVAPSAGLSQNKPRFF